MRISPAVPGPDGGLVEADVPSGGGVWVGGRWVLTCAHVVGPEPRTVMVRFSFAGGEPVPATVAPQGWLAEQHGDLALLELDRDPTPAARPVLLRPARAVTGHGCAAYGYPVGFDGGVWSEPEITGQTADRLQLTAQVTQGHQIERGFSGTGLVDTETGAVVGLVVTRDRGKDVLGGFAIPLQAVAAAFPQLGPWTGWRLGTDRFLRQHWRPRARGVYQDTTPGWYFTGRTALMRELTEWLEDGSPGRAARLVTGPAGTGKSAVLAWLCALSDPQLRAEIAAARPDALADTAAVPAPGRVSAAVWARGLDARGAAGALTAALTLPVAAGGAVEDVLAAAGDLDPAKRGGLVVVLDALDEARAPRDIARQLLVPLARDLGVKVLAGTRPGRDEELLAAFGERAVIYRLDDPAWFDRHDLADYAAACLRADFDPDLASGYRTNPGACRQVAAAIADAAGSNFLVAGLAARTRADETVIDIKVPGWRDWQRFPAEVGQAFDDYLARFGDNETRARDLLRAVAYAEGAGLPADAQWAEVASALAAPRRYGTDDLAWLLDSAASYLVESGGEHGQPTYRIFHQALIEHLRPPGKEQQAQRQIASTLIAAVPRTADGPDWAHAPSYIRGHLAAHTATAGLLDGLLEDPGFLVAADPAGLLPVLDSATSPQARQVAWFYRIAADGLRTGNLAERAAHLQLAAGKTGHRQMADALGPAAASWHWTTRVLAWRPPGRYTNLGRTRPAYCSALTVTAQGDVFVVTGGDDGMVALWRASEAGLVMAGDPQPGHGGPSGVQAVAVGQLGGQLVAVTGGDDGMVALWRAGEDGLVLAGDPQPGHGGPVGGVMAVAVGQLGGQVVAVTGGYDGTVALWRGSEDGLVLAGDPQPGHGDAVGGVRVVAVGQLGSQLVAVTGGFDDAVALWRAGEAGLVLAGNPQACPGGVRVVAVGQLSSQLVAVTGAWDGTVALWRAGEAGLVLAGNPQPGHDRPGGVQAVAVGQLGSQLVAVTGGYDGTVALWRAGETGLALAGDPQPVPGSGVQAVAVGQLSGQLVAVTGGVDGTVALWRAGETGLALAGDPQPVPGSGVQAVAVGQLSGQLVAVTGGVDGMVALWRAGEDGLVLAGDPQPVPGSGVQAVAVGQLSGQLVAVTGGYDGTVALWRAGEDGLVLAGDPQPGHDRTGGVQAVAVGQLSGQLVAVTGGLDGTVALWRAGETGLVLAGDPQPAPGSGVRGVAVGQLSGQLVAVTSGSNETVALWRAGETGLVLAGDPQPAPSSSRLVAVGQLSGQLVAVTSGWDGMVALWRAGETGLALAGDPQPGHNRSLGGVQAVAVGQLSGQLVAVTGGGDGTVALWQAGDGGLVHLPIIRIPVGSPPVSIALLLPTTVLAWCEDGVLTAEIRIPQA